MGAEGLEPSVQNVGQTAVSENGGTPSGTLETDSVSVAQTRLKSIIDLNQALASLKTWQAACKKSQAQATVSTIANDLRSILERCERLR